MLARLDACSRLLVARASRASVGVVGNGGCWVAGWLVDRGGSV